MHERPPTTLALRVECGGTPNENDLTALETLCARFPDALDLHFAHACMLDELGWSARARTAYAAILSAEPFHFGALTNLATLDLNDGRLEAAAARYRTATAKHPARHEGFANLGNALALAGEARASRTAYDHALALDPAAYHAHLGLAALDRAAGDERAATAHEIAAFARPIVRTAPYRGEGKPLRALVLLAANGGNLVTTLLLDDRRLEATSAIVETIGSAPLPAHDLIVNAIADADRSADALRAAATAIAASGRPAINPPERVLATGRLAIAQRLGDIPDVMTPRVAALGRADVTPDSLRAHGFAFPVLLRAAGYHAGVHFERVPTADRLAEALSALPGEAFFAIEPLPTRAADGRYRKYRVVFVDGQPYPVHLAVGKDWNVHYFSSELRTSAAARDEEAAFLTDMRGHIGPRAVRALTAIGARLALDYAGADFALDAQGRVLVFEANAAMALYLPEPEPYFAYRRPAVERVRAAFDALLRARAKEPRP